MTYNHNHFLYDLAKDDPKMIQQIAEPSMELIEMMILKGWFRYFPEEWKNERVCSRAIEIDAHTIGYIKNPSEDIQLAAVKQNGFVIVLIDNPSTEVQMVAYSSIEQSSPTNSR